MTWRARLLCLPLLLPTLAAAQPAADAKAAPQAQAAAPEARTVTLQFEGTLREALKKIAAQGGISLIVTGELNEHAEVMLSNASPEEALATVARLYHLEVEREGNIWTVRPMTDDEKEAAQEARERRKEAEQETHQARAEAAREAREEARAAQRDAESAPGPVGMVPVPPMPPMPPAGGNVGDEFQRRVQEKVQRKLLKKLGSDGRDLSGTGSVVVNENESVRDAVAFGGNLTVNGHVEGDAVAFGGNVHLGRNAVVEGDVTCFGGQVTREEGSVVEGKITAFSGAGVGTAIASSVNRHQDQEVRAAKRNHNSSLPGFILRFALLFGLGFLLMIFFPNHLKAVGSEMRQAPVRAGVLGLVGALALIPLTVILCITILGIPVAVALWAALCAGVAMGFTSVANAIGERLPVFRMRRTQALVLSGGTLVMVAALELPVIGSILFALLAMVSLGAVIRTRLGTRGQQGLPQTTSAAWTNVGVK
jgi:hypothetical protein